MHDSLLVAPAVALIAGAVLLVVMEWTGRLLIVPVVGWRRTLPSLALTLPCGMIFLVGVVASIGLRRFNYLSMLSVVQIGFLFAARRWRRAEPDGAGLTLPEWGLLALTYVGAFAIMCYVQPAGDAGAGMRLPHFDLSFFALLAQEVPRAGHASLWAATLGEHARSAGVSSDIWYHWGPMWLTCAVSSITGMSDIDALLHVVTPVLHFVMVIALAAVAWTLTGWRLQRVLPLSFAAVLAMSWPTMALVEWMYRHVSHDLMPYVHWSLTGLFSYKVEAALVFGMLAAWLQRRDALAALLGFAAAVSAPHNVAGVGIACGGLGALALARRNLQDLKLAVTGVALMLCGWAAVKAFFGVGLPKTDGAPMFVSEPGLFMERLGLLGRDLGAGLMEVLLLVPGLVLLVRASHADAEIASRVRSLGWLVIGALIACYPAYEFLLPTGERVHFVNYAHAVFIYPVGFLGLALGLTSRHDGRAVHRRLPWASGLLMLACVAIPAWDMRMDEIRSGGGLQRYREADLLAMRAAAKGGKIGYFAASDRNWWIPRNSLITSFIGSACVRLNVIPEVDEAGGLGNFYGSAAPFVLVPRRDGESGEEWSLRFARALGVHLLMETNQDKLPQAVQKQVTLLVEVSGLRLYRLRD